MDEVKSADETPSRTQEHGPEENLETDCSDRSPEPGIDPQTSPSDEENMSDFYRGRRHGNSRPAPHYEKMHGNPVQHRSSGQSHSDSHHRSSNSSGNRSLAKVKVSNLSPAVHKDDLRFVFQEFGKVLNIEMIVGNLVVNNICYAIIEFDSIKSAEKAVYAMNEGVLDNRLVTVEMIPQADTAENAERHKRHRM